MMKRMSGFTLVELLVVVAIIALLVSILLPTLGKAKEQARMVMCLANLKALGLGYGSYTNQNNQWYPQATGCGGYDPTWDYVLMDYYGNRELLHCPSDPIHGDPRATYENRKGRWDEALWWDGGKFIPMPEKDRFARSYAMNANICSQGPSHYRPDFWPGWVHKTPRVTLPAETIMLSEVWYWAYGIGGSIFPNVHNDYAGSHTCLGYGGSSYFYNTARGPNFDVHRNNDAASYLFCDLRAAMLSEDDPKLFDFGGHQYYYFKVRK